MDLAKPTIAEGFERCVQDGATQIIVHPYMLSPGRHAMADIPRIVAEAAAGHAGVRYALTPPLGCHVKMAEVVLERAGLA
jgi:sirohydrochlorin ferrochelatase